MNADEFDESAFSYQLPLGDAGQLVRGAARDGRVLRLNGDPEDRLGAGRTDQQAAGGPERRLGALLRRAEDIVRLPLAPTCGLHVARDLRPERHFVGKVRERATLRARKVKHLERREDAVARRGVLAEDDVAGGLAAELGAKPFHGFPDIAIADLRALEADTVVSEHRLEAAVRHHRADHDLWVELSVTHEVAGSEEHTSELQSPYDLVCRLLLEKKKEDASAVHRPLKSRDRQQCKNGKSQDNHDDVQVKGAH